MLRETAEKHVRWFLHRARGDFSHHWYKERILKGEDYRQTIESLIKPRHHRMYERRMRLAGQTLDYVSEKEQAQKIFNDLLERNAAQPLWLKYAAGAPAHDIIVLDQYRIAYCPMPKNASSSIKARLNYLMSGDNEVYSHRFFTNVYETSQTTALPALENCFSFTVIRDPVERLVSYYRKNIIELGSLAKELELNQANEIMPTRPTLEDFVAKLKAYIYYFDDVHHHTLPQCAYIKTALPKLSRIYQIHETDSIFRELSTLTRIDLRPTYLLKSEIDTREIIAQLNDATLHTLRAFYAQDYSLLARWLPRISL